MISLSTIAALGSLSLAISGLPQLIRCIRTKQVEGVSLLTLSLIFLGCSLLLTYFSILFFSVESSERDSGFSLLIFNYSINCIISLLNIIFFLKYKK